MLHVERLTRRFPNGVVALDGIDLSVGEGEIVSVLGTSGCGKSTLLRLLMGLDAPSAGRVTVDGVPVTGPVPSVGVIFQEPRLMPWLSVADNVRFGIAKLDRTEREARLAEALELVGLTEFADAYPRELSGGMAQRVAIARALVRRPSILLLDEPFSALDNFTRIALQDHLLRIWAAQRITMVFVTHDIEEALTLGDRVIVMRGSPGRINREILPGPRPRLRNTLAFHTLKDEVATALNLFEDAGGI